VSKTRNDVIKFNNYCERQLCGFFGLQLVDAGSANSAMDIVYSMADTINKIGFGLVIYALSRSDDSTIKA
jgi:hypothetical protein